MVSRYQNLYYAYLHHSRIFSHNLVSCPPLTHFLFLFSIPHRSFYSSNISLFIASQMLASLPQGLYTHRCLCLNILPAGIHMALANMSPPQRNLPWSPYLKEPSSQPSNAMPMHQLNSYFGFIFFRALITAWYYSIHLLFLWLLPVFPTRSKLWKISTLSPLSLWLQH